MPRAFTFHWGSCRIMEEAAYTEPAIQPLEYEGHPGSYGIAFATTTMRDASNAVL